MRGRKRTSLLLSCGLLLAGGCAPGGGDPAARIVEEALRESRAYAKLAYLTDRIGPRLSGSPNLDAAIRWAAAEFERDDLDAVRTEKVMVPHWERGAEAARIVSPVAQTLAVTALGGSVPTPEAGITAEVIEVSSFEEIRAAGEKARGRIVLYNKPIRRNGGEKEGYGSAVGLRFRGAVEAAKVGATAALIRSLGTAAYRLPHTGALGYDPNVPEIPAAAIASEDADLIHRLAAAGEPVTVHLALGCRSLPEVESANVVAELRGREKPDEIVLIGGHLDSWDLGTGAIDNGAGAAIVMETMRLLRSLGLSPRRTIRAVLFTNEENGLRGGRGYAEGHRDELPRHVAAIESDGGGARPLGFGVSAGAGGLPRVRNLASRLGRVGAVRVTGGGGGADTAPLGASGVPLLSLRQDGTFYFDYHHSAADTLDKISPRELAMNVAAMAFMAYTLAEDPEPLPRQVKAARSEDSGPPGRRDPSVR